MSRILIATIILVGRTGTEVVTLETARALRARGHEVAIFAQYTGPLAHLLTSEGFTVVDDIAALPWTPTVIQANQTFPLMEVIVRFPQVPVLSICHDPMAWFNEPIDLPSIRRHAAVSVASRDRIVKSIPRLANGVELLHNAVDLEAFRARGPLPKKPRRALILSHHDAHMHAVRKACDSLGVEVDALGKGAGNEVADLPARLVDYDLVFATGRMALEALAVGCAVVVADSGGIAGMVTEEVIPTWRDYNLGLLLLRQPLSVTTLASEIRKYDAADALRVSRFVRERCSLNGYIDRLEAIYAAMLKDESNSPTDPQASLIALGKALRPMASAIERQTRAEATKHHRDSRRLKGSFQRLVRRLRSLSGL
ncbi:MAG TPA: hypothetical protein VKW08_07410 [Xanthobacteraceae bacterium]|nr:hypothetical protein [Xanthobacteraceae bacterium]